MSQVEELVHELGYEVEKLTNKIQDEKNKMAALQNKLISITRELDTKEDLKTQMMGDIALLENTCFADVQQDASLSQAAQFMEYRAKSLEQALEEIRQSNATIRSERSKVIWEYREKLKRYEQCLLKNETLKAFVELWKKKNVANMELSELPETIKNMAVELSPYYAVPLTSTLGGALASPPSVSQCIPENPRDITELTEEDTAMSLVADHGDSTAVNDAVVLMTHSPQREETMKEEVAAEVSMDAAWDSSRLRLSALELQSITNTQMQLSSPPTLAVPVPVTSETIVNEKDDE